MSCMIARQRLFIGFSNYHIELSFLKSTFNEVWEKEPKYMKSSCTRFREDITANPYIFRYWQFAKNAFYPMKRKGHFYFLINEGCLKNIECGLNNPKHKSVCLNDSALCSEQEYEIIKKGLQKLLDNKFPQKSHFEI